MLPAELKRKCPWGYLHVKLDWWFHTGSEIAKISFKQDKGTTAADKDNEISEDPKTRETYYWKNFIRYKWNERNNTAFRVFFLIIFFLFLYCFVFAVAWAAHVVFDYVTYSTEASPIRDVDEWKSYKKTWEETQKHMIEWKIISDHQHDPLFVKIANEADKLLGQNTPTGPTFFSNAVNSIYSLFASAPIPQNTTTTTETDTEKKEEGGGQKNVTEKSENEKQADSFRAYLQKTKDSILQSDLIQKHNSSALMEGVYRSIVQNSVFVVNRNYSVYKEDWDGISHERAFCGITAMHHHINKRMINTRINSSFITLINPEYQCDYTSSVTIVSQNPLQHPSQPHLVKARCNTINVEAINTNSRQISFTLHKVDAFCFQMLHEMLNGYYMGSPLIESHHFTTPASQRIVPFFALDEFKKETYESTFKNKEL